MPVPAFILPPALLLAVAPHAGPASAIEDKQAEVRKAVVQQAEQMARMLQGGQLIEWNVAKTQRANLKAKLDALQRQAAEAGLDLRTAQPLNVFWPTGFFQYQYTGSDADPGANDAFRSRRVRLNSNFLVDTRTMGRLSVEFASGANQTTAQVRDGFIQYRPNTFVSFDGPVLSLGQMNMPLGYEIALPSWVRTWPERSQYEQAFFGGERGRGFLAQVGSVHTYAFVGVFNSLTINDPEQVNQAAGSGDNLGPVMGYRFERSAWNGGVSAFFTRRAAYTTGTTTVRQQAREFQYADLRYAPLNSPWDVRGEVMLGRDRVPTATANPTNRSAPVFGAHVQVDHRFRSNEAVLARWETFDRDRDRAGNRLNLLGVGYLRDVSNFLRLTATYEVIEDQARAALGQTRFYVVTFRGQIRF